MVKCRILKKMMFIDAQPGSTCSLGIKIMGKVIKNSRLDLRGPTQKSCFKHAHIWAYEKLTYFGPIMV